MATPAQSPESTAERLLAAAESIILREGAHAISVRRIATVAGENPALISYHFNGLDALLSQLLQLNVDAICDNRAAQQDEALRLRGKQQRLDALIAAYMEPFWTTASIWHPDPARTVVREVFPMLDRTQLSGAVARVNASVAASVEAMIGLLSHLTENELLVRLRFLAGAAETLRVRFQDVGLYPLRTSGNEREVDFMQTQMLRMSQGALRAR